MKQNIVAIGCCTMRIVEWFQNEVDLCSSPGTPQCHREPENNINLIDQWLNVQYRRSMWNDMSLSSTKKITIWTTSMVLYHPYSFEELLQSGVPSKICKSANQPDQNYFAQNKNRPKLYNLKLCAV